MKTCVIASLLTVGMAAPAHAQDQREHEIAELRSMVETLRGEVDVLRAEDSDQWLSERRSEQIRGIVQDVLADADTRASLQGAAATSGYKGGFFVQSADGNWTLKLNGQIQVRWNYNHAPNGTTTNADEEYGFHIRRAKLKFSGNVIDPSWGYKITIGNDRNKSGAVVDNNANTYLEDAWINKKMDDGWYFKAGQFKAPYLREEVVSSSAQLTVERSMINNQFTYGWAQGIELGSKNEDLWGRVWYGDGPNSLNQYGNDNGINSLVGRLDYKLSGDWRDWKTLSGRGIKSDSYAFVGAAFQWFNISHDRANSDHEYGGADATRSYGFTVDASVGGQGWTAFTYFTYADGKNGGGGNPDDAQGWGWVMQGGIDVCDDVQIFGRYELGDIRNFSSASGGGIAATDHRNGHDSTVTVGLNYWPASIRNVKFTADLGYAFSFINNGGSVPSADYTSSGNGWRADEDGSEGGQWLIRTQMQLLF
ncbi:MAG: hypothetical protein GY876_01425 [Planctomycetes bacterium]|nr:hypothetical protein [Planctomycetota bacterium]